MKIYAFLYFFNKVIFFNSSKLNENEEVGVSGGDEGSKQTPVDGEESTSRDSGEIFQFANIEITGLEKEELFT